MFNHAPSNYSCPICLAVNGVENEKTMIRQGDVFYRDDIVVGLISSKFIKNNPGHPLLVPINHYENIYDIPENVLAHISHVSKKVAVALKQIRQCDGVTILQNNEPAGDQHAFHYHLHILPRFIGDDIYVHIMNARVSNPDERIQFAEELRRYFLLQKEKNVAQKKKIKG